MGFNFKSTGIRGVSLFDPKKISFFMVIIHWDHFFHRNSQIPCSHVRRHVTSPGGQLGRSLGNQEAQRWKGGWARRAGLCGFIHGDSGGCLINGDGIHMD
jgi:hypothetical protein